MKYEGKQYNDVISMLTEQEKGKVQVNTGQMREVLSRLVEIMFTWTPDQRNEFIDHYGKPDFNK